MLSPGNFANSRREKSQACAARYGATSRRGQNTNRHREAKQATVAVTIAANTAADDARKENQATDSGGGTVCVIYSSLAR